MTASNANSIPLFDVCPKFLYWVEKPVLEGIVAFINKSLVVFQYASILPDKRLFQNPKSIPKLRVSVVSHFRSGLERLEACCNTTALVSLK